MEIDQRFYYEREPLIGGLLYELTRLGGLHRDWNDRDIAGALTALARNYERLTGSGIIYNESGGNSIHQNVAQELRKANRPVPATGAAEDGLFLAEGLRYFEGAGVPGPHGGRAHLRTAALAGFPVVSGGAVSGGEAEDGFGERNRFGPDCAVIAGGH